MSTTLPISGIHHGVPFETYQSWDAINYSTLKNIRSTPSKCKYAMDHPQKPTNAMVNGSALHVATLEPGRFDQMFYVCPPIDGRSKEGKELLAHHKAIADEKGQSMLRQGIKEDESQLEKMAAYQGMANAIRKSRAASIFLNCPGQNEVSMLWTDPVTQLTCKARADRITNDYVVEIKSTSSADEWLFGRDCFKFQYYVQAASYLQALRLITGKKYGHVIIAVESAPPHDLKVYILDDSALQLGEQKYNEWLAKFAECKKTNHWPGYPDKAEVLSLPGYATE